MQTPTTKISEEMQQKAKVCETIAEDKIEESLTGAPNEKEMNEEEAKDWKLKSQVWLQAEAVVRAGSTPPPPAK